MSKQNIKDSSYLNYGKEIRETLKKSGFSIVKFAKKRGVSDQCVYRKIRQNRWTLEQLYELAKLTGCEINCCFILKDGEVISLIHESEKGEV